MTILDPRYPLVADPPRSPRGTAVCIDTTKFGTYNIGFC